MPKSVVGLLTGLLVTIVFLIGGWSGFLLALVLGVLGLAIGAQLDGDVDIPDLFRGRRG
ncbi:DUF2273 domain-containing protein [Actinotalea sp. Marseille-Q4924]|uniref:DUF2273 domain-containing protein n=1 Tax=Actinotalea sp. Marseille-Q4924 TaxID=2866571 RepID=UPI001CE47B31|nr:DUF2273 domain-containing protein [Actinotalea sp. Marseille-Q4924]